MTLQIWSRRIALWACVLCAPAQADVVNRLVVPFPPGGSLDRMARMLAPELAKRTGQVFVVENRPGGDGSLAADYVRRSAGEEKNLLMVNSFIATGQVQGVFKFDVLTAFKPVIQLGDTETWLVARADFPGADLKSMLVQWRSGGHQLSCAAPPGQFLQACELLARAFPGQFVVAPFKGELVALQALMGGHVDLMFVTRTAAFEGVQGGRVRLLSTVGSRRSQTPFEHMPRLGASLPGLELHGYLGVFAPSGMEDAEITHLNKLINEVLRSESFLQFMQASHIQPAGGAPADMLKTFVQNVERQKMWQLPRSH
jgi:tripartite-type tricarboxylate transporter receptor subunit TctC